MEKLKIKTLKLIFFVFLTVFCITSGNKHKIDILLLLKKRKLAVNK